MITEEEEVIVSTLFAQEVTRPVRSLYLCVHDDVRGGDCSLLWNGYFERTILNKLRSCCCVYRHCVIMYSSVKPLHVKDAY